MLSGCGTVRSVTAFDRAAPGMSKAAVVKKVGHPAIIRGCAPSHDGTIVEVWEYKVGCGKDFQQITTETLFAAMGCGAGVPLLLESAETERYWLYFVNGRFAGSCPAGDWPIDSGKIRLKH